MDDAGSRRALLARAWDEAALRYERYFVPRFAPWVAAAAHAIAGTTLPAGPILVPCCGPFPELPALLNSHPKRDIIGIDLSATMVRLARTRATGLPRVRVVQGDATTLRRHWPGTSAGVVSVFGLQQLPDPEAALADWVGALRPGGASLGGVLAKRSRNRRPVRVAVPPARRAATNTRHLLGRPARRPGHRCRCNGRTRAVPDLPDAPPRRRDILDGHGRRRTSPRPRHRPGRGVHASRAPGVPPACTIRTLAPPASRAAHRGAPPRPQLNRDRLLRSARVRRRRDLARS